MSELNTSSESLTDWERLDAMQDEDIEALWEFTGFCIVGAGLVPARLWATTRVRPYTP